MLTREELIRAKVAEVGRKGKPSQIAFMATLLSCGGRVTLGERPYPQGFSDYVGAHGEEEWAEVRRALVDGGLIAEADDRLSLNYEGADEAAFQCVVDECADGLFRAALPFFLGVIEPLMVSPEGQYALVELGKGRGNQASVDRVSTAVGPTHWEAIRGKLAWAGLLVPVWVGGVHRGHAMFPPLARVVCLEDQRVAEAVAHVYIGQRVRTDGGILWSDCEREHAEVLLLAKAMGLVVEGRRFSFRTCTTSSRGDVVARTLIQSRLGAKGRLLEEKLSEIPRGVLQFLVNEVWTGPCGSRLRAVVPGWEWREPGESWLCAGSACPQCGSMHHYCLLSDRRIREWGTQMLEMLVSFGLAVKASCYVGTRGGELRETEFILSPEVEEFLRERVGSSRPLQLPTDLEQAHVLFHFFAGAGGSTAPRRQALVLDLSESASVAAKLGIAEARLLEEVETLRAAGVVVLDEENRIYCFAAKEAYLNCVRNRYFRPILDHVFGEGNDRSAGRPTLPSGESEDLRPATRPPGSLLLGDVVSANDLLALARNRDLTEDGRRDRLAIRGSAYYPLAVAATHTAIFGANGSGKSVTTKRLLHELVVSGGVPATVIDWHDEYDDLVRKVGGVVAVPPTATVSPKAGEIVFTWNLLDPRFYAEQVTREVVEDYVQIVVDLVGQKDVMDLTEPMKCALTEALRLSYERIERPTFKDVVPFLDEVPAPDATKAAVARRLDRFSGGSLGKIFCRETSLEPDEIFTRTLCIRVKHLTQDHQSAVGLLAFFLLRQAIGYFKRMGEASSDRPVRHVIVIDEAPMVLRSNPRVQQEVVRMVQEVRKFGEGLVLVCRNPGIDKEILRETNQKIAHRLEVPDDVSTVAAMLGLDRDQRSLLAKLPRGVGFLRIGTNPSVLVRFRALADL